MLQQKQAYLAVLAYQTRVCVCACIHAGSAKLRPAIKAYLDDEGFSGMYRELPGLDQRGGTIRLQVLPAVAGRASSSHIHMAVAASSSRPNTTRIK